jgi:hypothetical protein
MTAIYVVCFTIGVVALVGSVVLGEFGGADHHGGVGGHTGDGVPILSLTTIATGIFGFGAGGWGTDLLGLDEPGPAIAGAVTAVALVLLFRGLLLPYLLRQQSNSHFSRRSFVGLLGRVELAIPLDGWGEIVFTNPDGSRVRAKAKSAEPVALPAASRIYITDVDDEFVHVISVPDLE